MSAPMGFKIRIYIKVITYKQLEYKLEKNTDMKSTILSFRLIV